jgi:hypothetical protein
MIGQRITVRRVFFGALNLPILDTTERSVHSTIRQLPLQRIGQYNPQVIADRDEAAIKGTVIKS